MSAACACWRPRGKVGEWHDSRSAVEGEEGEKPPGLVVIRAIARACFFVVSRWEVARHWQSHWGD